MRAAGRLDGDFRLAERADFGGRGCRFLREDAAAVLDRFQLPLYFGGITRDEILDTMFYAAD